MHLSGRGDIGDPTLTSAQRARGRRGGRGPRRPGGGCGAQDEGLSGPDGPRPCGEETQCWMAGGQIPGGAADTPGTPSPWRAGRRAAVANSTRLASAPAADAQKTVWGRVAALVRQAGRGLHPLLYIFHIYQDFSHAQASRLRSERLTHTCGEAGVDRSLTHSPVRRPALAPSADSARHPVPPSWGPATCAPS